ncbi:MAG: hypothetical protein ABJL64_20100 [Rhizobiaceae bacterium]
MIKIDKNELNFNSATYDVSPHDPEFQSLPCAVKELVMMLGVEPGEALLLARQIGYSLPIQITDNDLVVQIRPYIPFSERVS